MAIILKNSPVSSDAHKAEMAKITREVNAQAGIIGEPTMTIEELHRYQVEVLGIRPEDNGASRELLRMRYGDDYDLDRDA